jgi:hypothetical protein
MVRTGKNGPFFKADADGFRYFSMIFQLFYILALSRVISRISRPESPLVVRS